MGFFSWNTQDSGRSISNSSSVIPTFRVYLMDDKGNVWREDNYEGYGVFGGKDYYELVAEMNGLGSDRSLGIDLAFAGKSYNSPNLVEYPGWVYQNVEPEFCEYQGFFYPDADEHDDWGYEDEEF